MEPQTITFTIPALEKVVAIRDETGGPDAVLLVEVTGTRGSDYAYELSFVPETHVPRHRIEYHGDLTVAVRPEDVEKLSGATVDLESDGLAMNNPNQPVMSPSFDDFDAGTIDGPLAERVALVLERQVNPAIAAHGGGTELVGVEGSDIFLRLLGGCQGCGLASVTLRQGIERILRQAIPELGRIVDVTDHQSGTNPYYESEKK